MRRVATAVALACTMTAAAAYGDAFDRVGEGAGAYVSMRPLALLGALKRLGVDELPELRQLRAQLGGLDVLNPNLLEPTGVDIAGTVAASLETAGGREHARVVVPLKNAQVFRAFLGGVGGAMPQALQAVAPDSPLGRKGVLATVTTTDPAMTGVIRLAGEEAIADLVGAGRGKAPRAAEILARYPLAPKKAFRVQKGARRLFQPEAALVVYFDGRQLHALLPLAGVRQSAACAAAWRRAPSSFDDVGLALAVDPDALELRLAWGTQAGPPLGGLALRAVDDGSVDVDLVRRRAPAVLALYAASLRPFQALRRSGPLASSEALAQSLARCGDVAWASILTRAWPQALGALLSGGGLSAAGGPMAPLVQSFGQLRNVVLMLRDATANATQYAITATLDPAARQLLQMLLASAGGAATPTPMGKRTPSLYRLALGGTQATAALDALPAGPLAFTLADSDESVGWAYQAAVPLPGAAAPAPRATPIAALYLDGVQLKRLAPLLAVGRDGAQLFDKLARLGRLDAEVTVDGDVLRLSARAPLR